MKTILFYCPKGGVGTSTLAALCAWRAARRGLQTVVVSIDFTASIVGMLIGREQILRRDDLHEVEPKLSVTWEPDEMPLLSAFQGGVEPELVIVDMKYGGEIPISSPIDLMLSPVCGEDSLRNLVSGRVRPQVNASRRMLSLNRQSFFNDTQQRATNAAADADLEVHPVGLPDAASICSAAEQSKCLWDTPFRESWSSRRAAAWADHTLSLLFAQIASEPTRPKKRRSQKAEERTS